MDVFADVTKIHGDGITIKLVVTPDASKSKFPAGYNKWRKRYKIRVRGKAKNDQANVEVVNTIADFFNKHTKNVRIISGKKTKEKTVLIENISKSNAHQILKESFNGL
jgi:uncharacterized protein (TIGR00251 family)